VSAAPLILIHQGPDLVVVDKPWGLVSAGPPHQIHGEPAPRQSVESLLAALLGRRVWAIHQLDRMTSGLNAFALKASAVHAWAELLKVPGAKRYVALTHLGEHPASVRGAGGVPAMEDVISGKQVVVDLPLGERREAATGKTFPAVVAPDDPSAKAARSRVQVLALYGAFAKVEVIPETGRTHQVRLHLAAIGMPLIGEPIHRDPPCTLHPRHALHAAGLRLGEHVLESPLPEDLVALAMRLGL